MCKVRTLSSRADLPTFFENEQVIAESAKILALLFCVNRSNKLTGAISGHAVKNFLHSFLVFGKNDGMFGIY